MSGHSSHAGPGHETVDITFINYVWIVPFCMTLLIAYVLVCWFGATASLSREMARKQTVGAQIGSQPLDAFRAQEDSSMHGYATKEDGSMSIPIDRAMEKTVEESGSDNAKAP